jgi:hypothetical protein
VIVRRLAPLILCGLLLSGCAGRTSRIGAVPDQPSWSAIYKGRFTSQDGETLRFKAWIWAGTPDRLHVEVFGPMGGTRLTVDGGGGRLAVASVQDKVAFVGEAGSLALSPVFGVSMTLAGRVSALTGGGRPDGLTIWRRDADAGGGLPLRLHVGSDSGLLELTRMRVRPVPASAAHRLGNGEPPPGIPVRPLAELWESGDEVLLQ